MYTMHRTQIYLSDADIERLDRESSRTGRTRSRLIRDAIERRCQKFDFLRGEERYKYEFEPVAEAVYQVTIQ